MPSPSGKAVGLFCDGSRGDHQPYVALALALQREGYAVTLFGAKKFNSFATQHGVEKYINLAEPEDKEGDWMVKAIGDMQDCYSVVEMNEKFGDKMTMMIPVRFQQLMDYDLSVFDFMLIAPTIQEYILPFCHAHKGADTYAMAMEMAQQFVDPFKDAFNMYRRKLGAPEIHIAFESRDLFYTELGGRSFHGYSPVVVPPGDDWGEREVVVGYFPLQEPPGWEPSPALAAFLQADTNPPIYCGFGSMVHKDPEQLTRFVIAAVRNTKQRAILCEGWGSLKRPTDWKDEENPDILFIELPIIGCPVLVDQPFWSFRTRDLGCGLTPTDLSKVTEEILTEKIQTVLDTPSMQEKAKEVSAKLARENGVQRVVDLVNEQLNRK